MSSDRAWVKVFGKQFLTRAGIFLGVVAYGLFILLAMWIIDGLIGGGGARWFIACMKLAVFLCRFSGGLAGLGCGGC